MLLQSLVNIIFPTYCFSCKKLGKPLCHVCAKKLTCRMYARHVPHGFDEHIRFFHYGGTFKSTLRGAKYFSVREALDIVCTHIPDNQLRQSCTRLASYKESVFVPIPLHSQRFKERGFNQAEIIAQFFSKHTGIPVRSDCIIRHRYTAKQARLTKQERFKNLYEAFSCTSHIHECPQRVILVDDVWTTGTTMRAAAALLKKHTGCSVSALTLA